MKKKTPAQLDREINEALRSRPARAHASKRKTKKTPHEIQTRRLKELRSAMEAAEGDEASDPSFDGLNTIAWHDFITWAWSEPETRAQFTAKTGVEIQAITAPIDAAIDAATGASKSVAARFIEWATREHWGLEHAPVAYQKALANQSAPP